jgi:putative FmdB family regulatory protein
MPIYEYACENCGHSLDELQKISDDPLVDCPECGKPQLRRLLSAPRFRLKGEGWYETDFKKDKQRNLSKGDGDGAAASGKADDSATPSTTEKSSTESAPAKSADKSGDSQGSTSKTADSKATPSKSTASQSDQG